MTASDGAARERVDVLGIKVACVDMATAIDMLATHMMGFRQEFTGGFLFDDVAHRLSSEALLNP